MNLGEVRRAQLAKSTLLTSTLVPLGSFQIFLRSIQMLKREWGAESNRKLPHLSIPSKTASWVLEFAVENVPLSRTAALILEIYIGCLKIQDITSGISSTYLDNKKCVTTWVAQVARRLATDWIARFDLVRRRGGDFLRSFVSRLVLGSTQLPIK